MIGLQEDQESIRVLEHVLCGLILLGRLGDIASTRLITPNLVLEANPIMRRLGWRFAALTVLVCLVPYYSWQLGVMLVPPFFLISANNISRIWVVRAMGERQALQTSIDLARRSSFARAAACTIAASSFLLLTGVTLAVLARMEPAILGYPERHGSFIAEYFGYGIATYGLAILLHGLIHHRRIFGLAAQPASEAPETEETSRSK